ncbi:anti-sigma factor domain-containing protein [Geobacillus sp. FJAT-46040]|uniref:anti-sigma factor domain-containing protein n=1 Tax=Geobacillus sp. FJAT-46040 TaxID=2011017 RepID=UPI0035107EEA
MTTEGEFLRVKKEGEYEVGEEIEAGAVKKNLSISPSFVSICIGERFGSGRAACHHLDSVAFRRGVRIYVDRH